MSDLARSILYCLSYDTIVSVKFSDSLTKRIVKCPITRSLLSSWPGINTIHWSGHMMRSRDTSTCLKHAGTDHHADFSNHSLWRCFKQCRIEDSWKFGEMIGWFGSRGLGDVFWLVGRIVRSISDRTNCSEYERCLKFFWQSCSGFQRYFVVLP